MRRTKEMFTLLLYIYVCVHKTVERLCSFGLAVWSFVLIEIRIGSRNDDMHAKETIKRKCNV